MSDHPHRAFLDELALAIKKFVPLTPAAIKEQAEKTLAELEANPQATAKQIHDALVDIGRKEYPYRKAYHDLCDADEEQRLRNLVLQRVDEKVRKVLEEAFSYNILLDDFVRSEMFEEKLSADERYQVTNAVLMAEEDLDHQCDDRANARGEQYETLVERRQQEVKELQERIDHLKLLAKQHALHADEIHAVIDRLEEGWSVTSPDPTREEIEKEIEYWQTVTSEEVGV